MLATSFPVSLIFPPPWGKVAGRWGVDDTQGSFTFYGCRGKIFWTLGTKWICNFCPSTLYLFTFPPRWPFQKSKTYRPWWRLTMTNSRGLSPVGNHWQLQCLFNIKEGKSPSAFKIATPTICLLLWITLLWQNVLKPLLWDSILPPVFQSLSQSLSHPPCGKLLIGTLFCLQKFPRHKITWPHLPITQLFHIETPTICWYLMIWKRLQRMHLWPTNLEKISTLKKTR